MCGRLIPLFRRLIPIVWLMPRALAQPHIRGINHSVFGINPPFFGINHSVFGINHCGVWYQPLCFWYQPLCFWYQPLWFWYQPARPQTACTANLQSTPPFCLEKNRQQASTGFRVRATKPQPDFAYARGDPKRNSQTSGTQRALYSNVRCMHSRECAPNLKHILRHYKPLGTSAQTSQKPRDPDTGHENPEGRPKCLRRVQDNPEGPQDAQYVP